jgi:hypothetical protein
MNKDIREIMRRLGEVVNETMQESERVRNLLVDIEKQGYTVTLSLAVVIGSDDGRNPRKRPRQPARAGEEADGGTSAFDRKFMKALRIRYSEEPHA